MLRRKLPDELFDGRRTHAPRAVRARRRRAPTSRSSTPPSTSRSPSWATRGAIDVFAFTRRLGHRMGLAAWAGERPSCGPRFDALVDALDELDGSAAFVHPEAMAAVGASGQARRARRHGPGRSARVRRPSRRATPRRRRAPDDLFARVDGALGRRRRARPEHRDRARRDPRAPRRRCRTCSRPRAGCWASSRSHPAVLARVRAGEPGLVERCALESTRLGQRSVMLRAVLRPTTVADERHKYRVEPGAQIATLLPLTNTSAMPGLDRLRPRPLGAPTAERRSRVAGARAGHHVRARRAHLSRAAVLARRDVPVGRALRRHLRRASQRLGSRASFRSRSRSAGSRAARRPAKSATAAADPVTLTR